MKAAFRQVSCLILKYILDPVRVGALLLFLTSVSCYSVNAQTKLDTLIVQLSQQDSDSGRVRSLITFYKELKNDDPDLAINYIQQAHELAEEIEFIPGIVDSQVIIGSILEMRAKYDSALYFFQSALSTSEKANYRKGIIDALTGKGATLRSMSKWKEAEALHLRCISMSELAKGDSAIVSDSYNHLGNIYSDQHHFESALEYYHKSADLAPEFNRTKAVATLNIGFIHFRLQNLDRASNYFMKGLEVSKLLKDRQLMAHCYQKIGFIKRDLEEFEDAKKYYNLAIEEFEKINDRSNVAFLYSNIGNIYYDHEDYESAIIEYEKSLAIQTEIDDRVGMCYTLVGLGTAYGYVGQYKKAEKYLLKVRALSLELGVQLIASDAAMRLSEIYASRKNFEKAYNYHREFKQLNDSIFNSTKSNQIAEMETRFETKNKEREIELLNADNEINLLQLSRRESQRNYLMVVAVIICILVLVLYNMYKVKAKSNWKLKELDNIKTRFFTNISHEFRTPLTLIIGPLEQKLSQEITEEDESIFKLMHRNANRLLELINQLLDLSKLDSGASKLNLEKGDLNNFIKTLSSAFYSLADQKRIYYEVRISEVSMEAYFDSDKIQKIVYNLLSNAFKFTPDGGKIIVTSTFDTKVLSISVIDSGKGILKKDVRFVFERFNQLEATSGEKQIGSGVGLALTKELVELHHGEITVSSEIDKGTEFTVTIPIHEKAYRKDEKVSDTVSTKSNVIVERNDILIDEEFERNDDSENIPLVLLIEDNDDMRLFISKTLKGSYKVIEAKNGAEGLDLAFETIPNLIVSDLMMPKMNGIEFCNAVKSDKRTSHIPVILLTAKADTESKLEGLETGADDYLTKPFDAQELLQRIKNLIEQRKKLRQHYGRVVTLQPADISITPPDETFLKLAFDVVQQNMSNGGFTVEQFQKEMGLSRMQLHRKLTALTDCSASEFIRTQRLKRAAQLLQSKGMNVSEAAYTSGFNNLSYFAKCFKEQFESSPSEYAQKHKN